MVDHMLWGARHGGLPEERAVRFTMGRDTRSTPAADCSIIGDDVWASRAHVTMLAERGIISSAMAGRLLRGLGELEREYGEGGIELDARYEDGHTAIEARLGALCGPEIAACLHTGRSRNDQVVTAMRLYMRRQVLDFTLATLELIETLLSLARDHRETIVPGFTHYQPATPTTLGHVLAAYAEAFSRAAERFIGWLALHNTSPLGGVAGYGTTLPIDRDGVSAYLAFDVPHATTLDAVNTRGEPESDCAYAISLLMQHLAGLAQTVIVFSMPMVDILRLSPSYTTGSSIMPQKMNPDCMEVMKAKAAAAVGAVTALLSTGASSFMGYNRDSQWTKYHLLDLVEETREAPSVMAGALASMRVNRERAQALASENFVGSTALMEHIVGLGVPMRKAKTVVERAVRLADESGAARVTAAALQSALADYVPTLEIDPAAIAAAQEPDTIVRSLDLLGGAAPVAVDAAIGALSARGARIRAEVQAMDGRIARAKELLARAEHDLLHVER